MTLGPRPALALALPAIAGALLMLAQAASAQQDAPKAESLERAQKAADAVFHWIKLNADKGASRDKPAAAPAPAPAPVARKPAPAPVTAAAPKPAAVANAAPAPVPAAPAPTAVAAAPQAAPEPEPELERAPVVLASAAPTPAPAAPMAAAARAAEPPPKPAEEEVEEPLRLLAKVEPTIPRQLQQGSFRTGFAQVQFTVGPDGSVQQASVIKASHSRLGTAAVDAVKQWRFAPIRKAREAAVEVAFKGDTD
ncbi:TonB family protein [Pelomonas saccharophila]|uniref:TonB family protein n=1 Tax=Roseateles saccharophilus TaxID=304 RepID=A0ABU1YKL1_ROSSA|nr:TonB family protein [Roseateles saccharophilus]MDR7269401.1 TonB family protein [Roseateles saccharophilus]